MVNSDDRKEEKEEESLGILKRRITRREALSKVGTAATVAGVAVVAGVGGGLVGQSLAPTKTVTSILERTVTAQPVSLGATPAERAVNAVKQLRAEGKIPDGTRMRFLLVAFAKANILPEAGTERPGVQPAINIAKKWEDATGVGLDIDILNDLELYAKAISEGVTHAGTWDFMSQRIDFIYDFIGADAIIPLGQFEKRYDPELNTGNCPVFPVFEKTYRTPDGNLWGFPGCGDWFSYYNRRDIVTDPKIQEAFEKQYAYPLPVDGPTLWSQVLDMANFFDQYKGPQQTLKDGTTQTLRGGYFFRDNWFSNIEFKVRFYELGGLFFDNNKNVTIDGPQARKAIEDMKPFTKLQSKDAFTLSWPQMYPDYFGRKVFQTISWASVAQFVQFAEGGGSLMGAYHIPGYVTNGKLIRTTIVYDQTSYVVGKWGKTTQKVPELPYLLGQYLTDPEIYTESLANPGAISDHARTCQSKDIRMIKTFAAVWPPSPDVEPGRRGAMEAFDVTIPLSIPPLQIQGLKELQDLFGTNMNAYFTDLQDLDTTVKKMQAGADAIVDRFGRDKQFERFQFWLQNLPAPLKELHGIA